MQKSRADDRNNSLGYAYTDGDAEVVIKYSAVYAATLLTMVALDALWLGVIAKPVYQQSIGHLMAAQPNFAIAGLFYMLFAVGLMWFSVTPDGHGTGWSKTILSAAMFGFFAYATYDMTNLSTLRDWPVGVSILDVAWGTLVSAVSAGAGKLVLDRFVGR